MATQPGEGNAAPGPASPALAYPPEIRRVIYTTNAIESLNSMLRKVTQNRGSFPSDEACAKLMYLALKNASAKWNRPMQNRGAVVNQLLIMFEDRMPVG
jgi:putative transposase